jgi:hypothetical protein
MGLDCVDFVKVRVLGYRKCAREELQEEVFEKTEEGGDENVPEWTGSELEGVGGGILSASELSKSGSAMTSRCSEYSRAATAREAGETGRRSRSPEGEGI